MKIKTYFFTMLQTHHKSGKRIGKIIGVVSAVDETDAENKAWELAGNDAAYGVKVIEIDIDKGFRFTVFKSEI